MLWTKQVSLEGVLELLLYKTEEELPVLDISCTGKIEYL